jgi:hypothetical protein
MLQRLTKEKEFDIMLPETHRRNNQQFSKLLPNFYLDTETNKHIRDTLYPLSRSWKDQFLDNYFNLNSQRRAFYYIPVKAEYDSAYKRFLQYIKNKRDECNLYDMDSKFSPKWCHARLRQLLRDNPEMLSYDTFVSNKLILANGTSVKLFKFLMKNKVLEQAESDDITTRKQGTNKLYFCISRNPVDYLFAATNQPYSSCISLTSSYEEAAFMGLAGLAIDPNRFMLIITKGRVKNHTVKGYEFRHLGMTSRSWGIMYSNHRPEIVGVYPHTHIDYADLFKEIGHTARIHQINPIDLQGSGDVIRKNRDSSLFNFNPPRYIDNQVSTIYLDGGSPLYKQDREHFRYDFYDGRSGVWSPFNCGQDFEEICDFDDLNGGYSCCECGDRYSEDDMMYADGDSYCEHCFYEYYLYCEECNNVVYKDDAYHTGDNYSLCPHCYENRYETCEECGEGYQSEFMTLTVEGIAVCEHCIKSYTYSCIKCEAIYYYNRKLTELEEGLVCPDCLESDYIYCDSCNEYKPIDEGCEECNHEEEEEAVHA